MDVILSIDQSTSGTKGLVWDCSGKLLSREDIPHRQITDRQGWVAHDPMEILENTVKAAQKALTAGSIDPGRVRVIGLSNQRETALCWDRVTGQPLYNAIVWQCPRGAEITHEIEELGKAESIREITGLALSPYFSAAKYAWILRHVPAAAKAAKAGTLCCGTVDSWLVYKLTGCFKTDYSNASRTQLLNLDRLDWDPSMTRLFGIPPNSLPELCDSDSLFGCTDLHGLLPAPVPIHGVLGDSHAALFGNQCQQPYTAKVTYGTGSSVMMNVGKQRPKSPRQGIVTSLAWRMEGQTVYALEGNINYTGAVTKWMAEEIGLLPDAKSAGDVAQSVPDTGGVYLIPAFSGLGAPYFNDRVRAAFLGMNRGTKAPHLVRAGEECIAYQIRDVVEMMNQSSPKPLTRLCADGGPTRDNFLMQFQADLLDLPLTINAVEELSGMGAAYCAAIAAGIADKGTLFHGQESRRVTPQMSSDQRKKYYDGWKAALAVINGR